MNKKEKTMIVDKELETTTDEFIIDFYYLYTLENETVYIMNLLSITSKQQKSK